MHIAFTNMSLFAFIDHSFTESINLYALLIIRKDHEENEHKKITHTAIVVH